MANVLTTESTISCGHGGTVSTTSTAKLKIGDKPVLIKGNIGPTVSSCGTQTTSAGTYPCPAATITGGEASKLRVGGLSVMLDTLSGTTTGNPVGTPTAVAKQSKLTAS